MRKIALLIIIGLFLTIESEAKRLEGKILFENDTIDVTFNIPVNIFSQDINYEKMQHKIKYFDSTGKKVVIRPDQVSEIRFEYKLEEVRLLSRCNSSGLGQLFSTTDNTFLKLEVDGKLKMFKYYYTENSPMVYNSSGDVITGGYSYSADKYFLQKGNEELKRLKRLTFRKDMMEYFKDCPELSQKIENKEYRIKDLEAIVGYYNSY